MPELSQPKTPSTLSQMTRVEPSDGPDSDSMFESPYHEDVQTVSVPTKSGTEVPIRPHHQSDDRPSTSGISSRPSSRGGELDRDDEEVIQKFSVLPSTAEFDIQTRTFVKPLTESESEPRFAYGKRAPPSNTSGNSQSTQSSQSSQAVPPTSFEKSNQEHQVSARSAHQEPSLGPISQGLGKLCSWLSSWLTLNIQAPVDLQKDVQAPGSPLFQNIPGAQVQKAASTPHAQPRVPQSLGRSHVHGSKQLRRKNSTRPHGHIRDSGGPVRDQVRPPTRRDSPAGSPPLHSIAAKNVEVPPVTTSDTDDIFKVTDLEPADSIVVSQPQPSECVEQQDMNIEEEALVQPRVTHVNSADVSIQDTTAPAELPQSKGKYVKPVEISMQDTIVSDDLAESEKGNAVPEIQLVHNEFHGKQHVNPGEQLLMQTQRASDDQQLNGERGPTPRQRSVDNHQSVEDHQSIEDSRLVEKPQLTQANPSMAPGSHAGGVQKTPLSNAGQNMQHSMTPADTVLPTPMDTQQTLRGVNNRSGQPRVTKNRRSPSQPGPLARNSNPSSYTAAQLYQLAEYMKEQERLQEKQDWVKDLATKQEALDKANRHKSKLQTECAQLKASLQKHSRLSEHLKTFLKFHNGLGEDLGKLHDIKAGYDSDLRKLKNQLHADRDAVISVPKQIARLTELKANIFRLTKEQQLTIDNLEREKDDLEKRLGEASESLAEQKSRQATFDEHLQSFETARNSTADMLNKSVGKINDRLSEFKTFMDRSTSSSEASCQLLELMKKEGAVLSAQIRSSGTNLKAMNASVENLSLGFEKHFGALTEAYNSSSETRTEAENKVVAALEDIKSQFKTLEDLKERNAALREFVVKEEEKLKSCEVKIAKLEEDLTNKSNAEAGLRERINELQSSQASLESEKASAEVNKAKLLELTTSENKLKQDIEKLKSEKIENLATIAAIAEQKATLQREKGDLQGQISEVTRSLDEARNAVPDFGPEKARIEADVSNTRRTGDEDPADHQKAKKQIEDTVAERNVQVRKLCTSFRNEQVKLRTMREEVERDLAARNETIKNLQAQLDSLKEEYGNRSPAAWSEDIDQKDAEIKRLIDQSTEARHQFEKLQQDLDQTRRSAESALKKGAQDLQQRDAQIEALNEMSTAAHDSAKSLEQELAEVKRSKEATLKSVQEDATRKSQDAQDRLKAMEIRLSEVNSAKLAVETRFSDHEKRSSDEAGQRQKDISDLQRHLEIANRRLKEMDERHTQQQEVLRQKDSDGEKLQQENEKLKQDIDKLQQERAKAASNAVQIPNSQPQEDVQDQTSTPSIKKGRKAVDRSGRSASKPTSSVASASETQPTSDVLESTQPRSTGASIFGPFSKPRDNSYNTRRDISTQEDDEMLDMGSSQLSFLKPTSRPASSQSETQRASSLGSQEVLTAEGVRFRSQNNQRQAETQPQSYEHISPSSSLSEPRDLDTSYRNAALEESQSQERPQDTQQQSQQQSQDVAPQSQQQSLGLSIFDDLAVAPHAFETPMKAGGKNLQGMGKKLTPRPESQPRQSRSGALQPIATPKLPRGSAVNSRQQKKVSALSSGPHNFKTGSSGKGKRIAFDMSDAEEDDDDDDDSYSPPNSSARGSRSPQKRPAPQTSKTNKRQRTETATPAPASQRSTASTPRRSQTMSATPGRRRSSRTNKEQNMVTRFNEEMRSPHVRR
ncbi:hypothetical protein E4T52_12308 [Aureobasidium sp. EXF-3400]|nr:hypothetical protein E4T51_11307 [Aureobasidium sp. EXF-12344]KAI4772725.1 hypothetical protein E4T52_12308 [Aureobasidium sp. EXF-3400]